MGPVGPSAGISGAGAGACVGVVTAVLDADQVCPTKIKFKTRKRITTYMIVVA